jgi:hypothetical protein
VTTAQGASAGGERQSAPVLAPCSASGAPETSVPVTGHAVVGVDTGGLFVWPTPGGLRATPAQG